MENRGPARLYRNDLGAAARVLRVTLTGTRTNRDAIGARIDLTRADGTTAWALVKTGSCYLSQSELGVTFGLGPATTARASRSRGPGGKVESAGLIAGDRLIEIREGSRIVVRTPLKGRR